uniref:Uncharacterized protein n=1 Tax=Myotis myotis TaxID=51298 RepID=A0A7J7Y0K7_MYOMY|nr:hypothetical protein mMyoMyo1_011396 [Myotis myotis]
MQPQTNPNLGPCTKSSGSQHCLGTAFSYLEVFPTLSPVLTPLQGQRRGQLPLAVAFALQWGLLGLQHLSSSGKPLAFYGLHVSPVVAQTTLCRSSTPTRCSCRASMPLASCVPKIAPAGDTEH